MEERLQFLSLFSAAALFLTAFGQWEGGMGGGGGKGFGEEPPFKKLISSLILIFIILL
jgi:hypothetical protein